MEIPELKMIDKFVIDGKEYIVTTIQTGLNKAVVVLETKESLEAKQKELKAMLQTLTD